MHIGLCPMAHLEVVKSKPVQVPLEHGVKVRVDLGHHMKSSYLGEREVNTRGKPH